MPSFVNHKKSPFIVGVLRGETAAADIAAMLNGEVDGAEAFDIHLHWLPEEERTEEKLRKVFEATKFPVLSLYYRELTPYNTPAASEEVRLEALLKSVEYGAAGVDIQADTYDTNSKESLIGSELLFAKKNPEEVTLNPEAVEKQKAYIQKVHEMGGEVLMSAHVRVELTTEETVELALEMEKRGADIVKIVASCGEEDYDHAIEMLKTINELKKALHTPFVYLGTGKAARITRIFGAVLGNCLVFGNQRYEENSTLTQPLISSAYKVLKEVSRDIRD